MPPTTCSSSGGTPQRPRGPEGPLRARVTGGSLAASAASLRHRRRCTTLSATPSAHCDSGNGTTGSVVIRRAPTDGRGARRVFQVAAAERLVHASLRRLFRVKGAHRADRDRQQSPRDVDAKRRLVAGITQAFVDAYGVRGEQVQVFIAEFDDERWAKAGLLAVDVSGLSRRGISAAVSQRDRSRRAKR